MKNKERVLGGNRVREKPNTNPVNSITNHPIVTETFTRIHR